MDVLIKLIVGILSQYICTSNHHIVHFKYIIILFANYTFIKLGGEKGNMKEIRRKF